MQRPNIILITASGLRHDCLGFMGNLDVRTPNIDALAAHGVHFEQAITTATHPLHARMSLIGVAPGMDAQRWRNALPMVLRQARYDTAVMGILGSEAEPRDLGFETTGRVEQAEHLRGADDYHRWLADRRLVDRMDSWDRVNRDAAPEAYWRSFGAVRSNLDERHHVTTWIGNQAVRHIQRVEGPFFLWVSFTKPAHPFDPASPWAEMYSPAALRLPPDFRLPVREEDLGFDCHFDPRAMTEARFRRILAHYYANISHLDHQVGRMLATLTARGVTNNLIVFCGVYGDYMGQHGLVLGAPGRPYDSLLRVPLIVGGLGRQRRGATDPALVRLDDVPATILDVAGLQWPDMCTGQSLVRQLRSPGIPLRPAATADALPGQRVARTATGKLVLSEDARLCACFDLSEDPGESSNLFGRPEAEARVEQLRQWLV